MAPRRTRGGREKAKWTETRSLNDRGKEPSKRDGHSGGSRRLESEWPSSRKNSQALKGSNKLRGGVPALGGRGSNEPHERAGDPDNENLYTDVDRFHMQKDKIALDGAAGSFSDESGESEQEEAVMNLDGVDGVDGDSLSESSGDSSEDDSDDVSELPELPDHLRRAAMEAASSDDSEDDEDDKGDKGKFAAGWGKNRSSYYDADTADLEIGQEFEDAEAEEEAALELQRSSYKRLDPADFGEEERGSEDKNKEETLARGRKGNKKAGERVGASARGAALLEMKSDLEQIALGARQEMVSSVVKKDTSKLSRRDKLERVLSEAPELPSLLAEMKTHLGTLIGTVQPLVSNVTSDLGASEDGLVYLRTRQQLLLAYCMNVCFYMTLKAKGKSVKNHPVVGRLLSLRALLTDMSGLDKRMSPQVDLLVRALKSGVDLAGAAGGDSDEEEEKGLEEVDDDGEEEKSDALEKVVRNRRANGSGRGRGGEEYNMDEEDLEDEEAAFMGHSRGDGYEEDRAATSPSPGAAKKRRRVMTGAVGNLSLGDFGDEDVGGTSGDDIPNDGGGNILQGMVNKISQRERTRKRVGLQGDQDVPVRERDQTIRVRRPVPGEDEGSVEGEDAAQDSDADDLGLGGDGFMGGLPPGLLEGLSRLKPTGDEKWGSKEGKTHRRGHVEVDEGRSKAKEDAFYVAIAGEKDRKKRAKKEKYQPESRIAGALEAQLEADRATRGETKRGVSYTIIKNRGLTPHKNKLNRNPRTKKREKYREAIIRRKGQVREIRTDEADSYGGESTGIKTNVTRGRKLKG